DLAAGGPIIDEELALAIGNHHHRSVKTGGRPHGDEQNRQLLTFPISMREHASNMGILLNVLALALFHAAVALDAQVSQLLHAGVDLEHLHDGVSFAADGLHSGFLDAVVSAHKSFVKVVVHLADVEPFLIYINLALGAGKKDHGGLEI